MADIRVNRAAKASVFEDLFDTEEMRFALYRVLHPEDTESTMADVEKITLKPILLRGLYNDLGLMVGKRLMILVEAQSTWSVNIIPRCIMYLAETWHQYAIEQDMNWYGSKKVELPETELYVIYTGDQAINKDVITLSEEFFDGKQTAIDASVKVITYDGGDDIIDQYIFFCKVLDDQRRKNPGDDVIAVKEAIRICMEKDVLKEYLKERQKEVVSIMLTLFTQQEAHDMEIRAERKEAAREAALAQEHQTILASIKALMESMGWSAEAAMDALKIPVSEQNRYLPELA